jgi:hypothetical protein
MPIRQTPQDSASMSLIEGMTLQEQIDFIGGLLLFFGLTVQIFLRKKTGLRNMKPIYLLILTGLMWFCGFMSYSNGGNFLMLFGCLFGAYGGLQYYLRWREIQSGHPWHTRHPGISWLSHVLGQFMPETIIQRFIDPLLGILIALVVTAKISAPLGSWLLLSSAGLMVAQQYLHEKQMDRWYDKLDNMIDASTFSRDMQVLNKKGKAQLASKNIAVLPTGLDQGLKERL